MATLATPFKRVKRKIKSNPNPLFEKWLKEWKNEAAKNDSEMKHCFKKALKSLQKYPLRLYSGNDCMMLENFGIKICKMIDDKLEKYKALHPNDIRLQPENDCSINVRFEPEKSKKRKSSGIHPVKKKRSNEVQSSLSKGKSKKSSYVPGYRSGGYAILITMMESSKINGFKGYMSKKEIQREAQALCDTSFTKALPGCHYTAWSSMGILVKKNLVRKEGNPAKFFLTEEGMSLAIKLKQANVSENRSFNGETAHDSTFTYAPRVSRSVSPEGDILPSKIQKTDEIMNAQDKYRKRTGSGGSTSSNNGRTSVSPVEKINKATSRVEVKNKEKSSPVKNGWKEKEPECDPVPDETLFLLPGNFEIKLIVDTQERDSKHQQASEMTSEELRSRGVNFEIRHLKVGDFIWIAKDLTTGHELVLPFVVERKRMDDLASSIKDGRFHEQKFRLQQSGVENLIYLVEKYGGENQKLGLPLPSLLQAISNTQVIDGFTVRVTKNHDHSMAYLSSLTHHLSDIFSNKTLNSCRKSDLTKVDLSDDLISLMTFADFNKGSEKNKKLTVRNMLVKHLIQLNGMSAEKAMAIVQQYPTPRALVGALRGPSGERAIAELTFGALGRSLGTTIAKQIHSLYTSTSLT